MNIAKILCNGKEDYCKEGNYLLVLNDNVIANHGCSNRSFANHDLTEWKQKELSENNVDMVMSNGRIVWIKDGDNSETMKEFYTANKNYETVHCDGYSNNWDSLSI